MEGEDMSSNANKLNMDRLPKGFMGQIFVLIIILLVIVIVAYSLIRFFIDQYNYQKGHQAFIQSNCGEAIPRYDDILNGRRLVDLGESYALAQQEKTECLHFLEATEKQQNQEYSAALLSYMDFIKNFRSSKLASDVRNRTSSLFELATPSELASQETCSQLRFLINENLIAQQELSLPPFYLACGQVYDKAEMFQESYTMYETYLTDYPAHSLAQTVETNFLSNPIVCDNFNSIKENNAISSRPDFMPKLHYHCGQVYESEGSLADAMEMYETFLASFPGHPLSTEVSAALARLIVAQAGQNSAGEIPTPERSGNTGSDMVQVTIQNDSPERLRIVFSGPDAHIEELDACASCTNYLGTGPLFCPELGPIGTYTLKPGEYDIVVESSSESTVTPWTGRWTLETGGSYDNCFFIVRTFIQ
jgi:tetratricopeptide (TPR) repeat protein